MTLLSPGINCVIDGQFGSTGKGKLASYLASRSSVHWATADFQPNAGHTTIFESEKFVLHAIPGGFVNRGARLYLTPASTLIVDDLLAEIEKLSKFDVASRLAIHPHAGIVTPEDAEEEKRTMQGIASTMKGTGAALARKIARRAKVAKDIPALSRWVADKTDEILACARIGGTILAESAQGFDLSLNHGTSYPFVTSRDVTTASILSNLGAPPQMMSRCWASMRTYPIRVGHLIVDGEKMGDSGPCYPDQQELTWDEVTKRSGYEVPLLERTTVTKRVRRVFTWSAQQYSRFLHSCQPTDIFLNFANYLDHTIEGERGPFTGREIAKKWPAVHDFCAEMDLQARRALPGAYVPTLRLLGTGPHNDEMIEMFES